MVCFIQIINSNRKNKGYTKLKGKLHHERISRIQVQNRKIEFVNEHKYLGIYIDKSLNFILHIQHPRNKINALSGILRRTI